MRRKPSIAIIGNCQARPLALAIQSLVPEVDIAGIAIVHLLRDAQESEYAPIFEEADLILAQRVTDNYQCSFVRNMELRRKYGERVRIWPNLYYSGYNPELCYLRGENRKPLGGPLGDYHNKTFYEAWRAGLPVDEAVCRYLDDDYNREAYGNVPESSLDELRKREVETDIEIVDWIAERMWKQRLFFTFNHPAQALIRELAGRLVKAAGLGVADATNVPARANEPLGQFGCPVNPWVAKKYGRTFDDPDEYHGKEVLAVEGNSVISGRRQTYAIRQVAEEFYRVYDLTGNHATG